MQLAACKTLGMSLPVLGALAPRYYRLRDAFEHFIGSRGSERDAPSFARLGATPLLI